MVEKKPTADFLIKIDDEEEERQHISNEDICMGHLEDAVEEARQLKDDIGTLRLFYNMALKREEKLLAQVVKVRDICDHTPGRASGSIGQRVREVLDSPVEPIRVTVEEADGYVCGLRMTDKHGDSGMIAYGYSYWSLMCPDIKPGDEILVVPLKEE